MKPLEHLDQAIHPSVLFNEMINLSNIDFLRVQRHMEKIQFQVDTDFTLSLGPYRWDVYQPNYSSNDINLPRSSSNSSVHFMMTICEFTHLNICFCYRLCINTSNKWRLETKEWRRAKMTFPQPFLFLLFLHFFLLESFPLQLYLLPSLGTWEF